MTKQTTLDVIGAQLKKRRGRPSPKGVQWQTNAKPDWHYQLTEIRMMHRKQAMAATWEPEITSIRGRVNHALELGLNILDKGITEKDIDYLLNTLKTIADDDKVDGKTSKQLAASALFILSLP